MNNIVFLLSDNLRNKLIKFYEPFRVEKTPPYAIMQAKNYDVTITLYQSGKVMFQGLGADIEASIWIDAEKRLNNKDINLSDKKKDIKEKEKKDDFYIYDSTIGSDETGCGDFFGPIVVCGTYVPKEKINLLKELGVKDSKKITDDKIKEITPTLIKEIDYVCYVLDNKTYNENYKATNMVKIKCILHNKVLCELIKKCNPKYKYAVIDEFVNEKKYYEYLNSSKDILRNISFYTKGESKCASVAAASIIARYVFLKEMNKLSSEVGFPLQKGASSLVDEQINKIINEKGKDYLKSIAKLNFNNYQKLN